jgi:hypothetical protein
MGLDFTLNFYLYALSLQYGFKIPSGDRDARHFAG